MPLLLHPILMQLPMAEAGQLLLVVGLSFAIITLIASTSRFHKMIQRGEDELISVDDRNDFFFIQVTRYLSNINRKSEGFILLLFQLPPETSDLQSAQKKLFTSVNSLLRRSTDKTCLSQEDCVAAILDTDIQDIEIPVTRFYRDLIQLQRRSSFRIGAVAFPSNGQRTHLLIDRAITEMEQAEFDSPTPYRIAKPDEMDLPDEENPEAVGQLSRSDKNSSIDPLTGVLNASSVASTMRKYLMDIRRKKNPAAVLCIGVNRMEELQEIHGHERAEQLLASISQLLQKNTREIDLIGRYQYEDFMILLPCSLQEGESIAIRLKEIIQKEDFIIENRRIKASVSIGIAGHPEHGRNLQDLFNNAFQALETVRTWKTSACLTYGPDKKEKLAARGSHA